MGDKFPVALGFRRTLDWRALPGHNQPLLTQLSESIKPKPAVQANARSDVVQITERQTQGERSLFRTAGCVAAIAAGIATLTLGYPAGSAAGQGASGAAIPSTGGPRSAAELSDAAAGHLARGQTAEAINAYSAALADTTLSNDRRATLLNDRGVAYARAGQVKLAIEDFNTAAGLFPEYAAIYNNRGNLLVSLGLLKEAMKDLDRAILLAPGYTSAYNNRAGLFVKLGKYGDAMLDYTRAVQLSPQSAAPLSGRGQVQLQLLRPHAAVRDFSRAVAADGRFAQGYLNRAAAKLMISAYDEAIEDLSRAAAFDVKNPEIYALRGEAYLSLRDIAAAIKDFSQAIAIDSKSVAAYQGRGLAHARADAFDEAFADLNRAIELDPRAARAFAYRAYVYKQTGQVGVGQKDIDTALKLDPRSGDVLWAKAEIEDAQGMTDQAIADAKLALQWKPGMKDALELLQRLDPAADRLDVVKGAAVEPWRVVRRGGQFEALSDSFPRLAVPLEMVGEGTPKVTSWERKEAPHDGFGILRFTAGEFETARGAQEIEMAALVDLDQQRVVALVPEKQDGKTTKWSFEASRITIAAIDGLTEEYPLDAPSDVGPLAGAGLAAGAGAVTRRLAPSKPSGTAWAPWNAPIGMPGAAPSAPKPAKTVQRKKKPKNIFELLFN
jgi:tetratricopeptide (TPR) repeat protein